MCVCVCACVCVCVHGKKDSKLTTHLEKEHQIKWQNVLAREIMQQEALQNLRERETHSGNEGKTKSRYTYVHVPWVSTMHIALSI